MKNALLFLILLLSIEKTNTYQIELANLETENVANYHVTKLNHGILFLGVKEKKKSYDNFSRYTSDYYFSEILGPNKFGEIKKIKIKGRQQRKLGAPTFIEESNELIFPMSPKATTRRDADNGYKLFFGYLIGNEIKDVEPLNFQQPKGHYSSPTVSANGLTLIFKKDEYFFESKRKTIYEDWPEPMLIEELVPLNPILPRFINDSLLTFSAASGKEIGSDDIYTALNFNGQWMPTRPWEELNSEWTDFGVTMIDSVSGYYSSGRNGETIQIYYFNTGQ